MEQSQRPFAPGFGDSRPLPVNSKQKRGASHRTKAASGAETERAPFVSRREMIRRYEEKQLAAQQERSWGAATDRGGGAAAGGKKAREQESSLRKWLFGPATDRGQTDDMYGAIDGVGAARSRGPASRPGATAASSTAAAAATAKQQELQMLSAQIRTVAYERDDVPLLGKGASPGSVTFKHSRDRKLQQREEGGEGNCFECCVIS